MTTSIAPGSNEASAHAHQDDDAVPSIETVIASLASRSVDDREALLKALTHGDAPPSTDTINTSIPPRSGAERQSSADADGDRENPTPPGPFARSSDYGSLAILYR